MKIPSVTLKSVYFVVLVTGALSLGTACVPFAVFWGMAYAAAPAPVNASQRLRAEYVRLRNVDPTTDNPAHSKSWYSLVSQIEGQVATDDKGSERLRLDGTDILLRLWRADRRSDLVERGLKLLNLGGAWRDSPLLGEAAVLRVELALAAGESESAVRRWLEIARRSGTVDPQRIESLSAGLDLDLFDDLFPSGDLEVPRMRRTGDRLYRRVKAVVVLDPGHGGDDSGAVGVGGLLEKDITLDVALRIRKLLEPLGISVLLTRDRDVFVPLARRTALANRRGAHVFLSLHNNASPSHEAHGLETYYLDNTDDQASRKLAERENSIVSGGDLDDLSFILSDLIQSGKIEDSIRLSRIVDDSLSARVLKGRPNLRSLGVKRAPFFVLVGAHMPCALVEMFFVDHPGDGGNLSKDTFRDALARAISAGIVRFVRGEAVQRGTSSRASTKPTAKKSVKTARRGR